MQILNVVHGGALPHFIHAVQNVHNNTCYHQWIDRGGSSVWPSLSANLNSLDFNLWGHLKTLVYITPLDSIETLHHHIVVRLTGSTPTSLNTCGIFLLA